MSVKIPIGTDFERDIAKAQESFEAGQPITEITESLGDFVVYTVNHPPVNLVGSEVTNG